MNVFTTKNSVYSNQVYSDDLKSSLKTPVPDGGFHADSPAMRQPSMANTSSSTTPHPAFGVNKIKNFIPIILNQENGKYASWVKIFRIHASAYNVLDHIDACVPRPPSVDAPTWNRIDAIVKQWIYDTISKDLLKTVIMKPHDTAQEVWTSLKELFQDNKQTTVDFYRTERMAVSRIRYIVAPEDKGL
ncbi:hypothetical protein OSB04_012349 [Centaurea solstitialis]|uniref:Uncharacterized protein n=1 Tax=Centaurea solstitialis TaxID=347529 RepID=A0AA38WMC8_9ASTR|nr:hypothetical protein OSB04_012349 [Centaurea solstitialis]